MLFWAEGMVIPGSMASLNRSHLHLAACLQRPIRSLSFSQTKLLPATPVAFILYLSRYSGNDLRPCQVFSFGGEAIWVMDMKGSLNKQELWSSQEISSLLKRLIGGRSSKVRILSSWWFTLKCGKQRFMALAWNGVFDYPDIRRGHPAVVYLLSAAYDRELFALKPFSIRLWSALRRK